MRKHFIAVWLLCALAMITAGCKSYYRVTDPASGKTYYTTEVNETGRAGAVKIKDEKTGSTVTLQSSEVKEISEDEFNAELGRQNPQK